MFRSVVLGFGAGNFFVQIAGIKDYAFVAIKSSGLAYSWGLGDCGQLGNGSTSCRTYPQPVCCNYQYCFVQGSLLAHSFTAIKSDGKAVGWGDGVCGILGTGNTNAVCVPTPICCNYCYTCLSMGNLFTIALKSDGKLVSWGYNVNGQLGDNTQIDRCQPVNVCCNYTYINISTSSSSSFGVRDNCQGYSWGSSSSFILGDCQSSTDKCVPSSICCNYNYCKIFSQSTGSDVAFGIKTDGTSVSWGDGYCYKLANGSTNAVCVPSSIDCTYSFKCFLGGYKHMLALDTLGRLISWGLHSCGQLGNGVDNTNSTTVPTLACCTTRCYCALGGYGSTHVAVGTDNKFYSWGYDANGALGNSNSTGILCIPTLTCSF